MIYHSKVKSLQPTTYDTSYPTGALSIYDDNQNGKISCKEARNHKITPVYSGHPAYPYMNDGDGDGVVCR
ncbi:excalibur calcium-binding domain-containing protein [Pseudoalteromonas shioyasakiensis]|uniref:excalibur calcium-binding domain-containing protein n=1 Tax=Pseudoalteromonas shioyasakiensis TaxID=1190813 RepID=UPI003CE53237